ncbi:DNA polymerase IV [Gracilibacillus thailandensis]|uniref:DNA polymerase IV n=1 Tax=Gracilibacillus thailandensis TaxID=563735 RepID=A0A6N7R3J9_9BACI|nr:DNA polymerase IV [Gracilibacillus thailandensis]MRI67780.1 DNA polymerase IV [Gracilibacillus thailandensis]
MKLLKNQLNERDDMKSWYPKNGRVILHVDMNSFYASVEIADNPQLKGKPLAIAGNPDERKGIVVTSSYEARSKGVKTTMSLWEAKKHCPQLIVKRPNFDRYREVSNQIFRILEDYTPYVEPVSIDEAFLDITDSYDLGNPLDIANAIQQHLANDLHLPCSIGIAPNKFLAKMASDMKKPNGITILRKRDVSSKLWPLPIEEMYGIGSKTAEKLKKYQIETIEDLVETDTVLLKGLLGVNGERLKTRALGEDPRPVDPESASSFKSIGSSQTFPVDVSDYEQLVGQLRVLSESVEKRLHRKSAVGDAIQLTIRYSDRKTITRRMRLNQYVEKAADILFYSEQLLEEHWNADPVRLLGITVQNAVKKEDITYQIDLFHYLDEPN